MSTFKHINSNKLIIYNDADDNIAELSHDAGTLTLANASDITQIAASTSTLTIDNSSGISTFNTDVSATDYTTVQTSFTLDQQLVTKKYVDDAKLDYITETLGVVQFDPSSATDASVSVSTTDYSNDTLTATGTPAYQYCVSKIPFPAGDDFSVEVEFNLLNDGPTFGVSDLNLLSAGSDGFGYSSGVSRETYLATWRTTDDEWRYHLSGTSADNGYPKNPVNTILKWEKIGTTLKFYVNGDNIRTATVSDAVPYYVVCGDGVDTDGSGNDCKIKIISSTILDRPQINVSAPMATNQTTFLDQDLTTKQYVDDSTNDVKLQYITENDSSEIVQFDPSAATDPSIVVSTTTISNDTMTAGGDPAFQYVVSKTPFPAFSDWFIEAKFTTLGRAATFGISDLNQLSAGTDGFGWDAASGVATTRETYLASHRPPNPSHKFFFVLKGVKTEDGISIAETDIMRWEKIGTTLNFYAKGVLRETATIDDSKEYYVLAGDNIVDDEVGTDSVVQIVNSTIITGRPQINVSAPIETDQTTFLDQDLTTKQYVDDAKLKYITETTYDNVNGIPTMTSNTVPAGWVASASNSQPTYDPWKVFDTGSTTFWYTVPFTYQLVSPGDYTGLLETNGYLGEHIQIQSPAAFSLGKYRIHPRADSVDNVIFSQAPSTFKLFHSNDGISWTEADSQIDLIWEGLTEPYKEFILTNSVTATYFRLVTNRAGNLDHVDINSARGVVSIGSMEFFATDPQINVTAPMETDQTTFLDQDLVTKAYVDLSVSAPITLQATYEASGEPEITTDATQGALTIREGVDNANIVLEIQNLAGTTTMSVDGNGTITSASGSLVATNLGGANNYVVGTNAGAALTTGVSNVLIGSDSGKLITTGNTNTIIGGISGIKLIDGINNTYIGYQSGREQTGERNTAVGSFAVYGVSGLSAGGYNSAVGFLAMAKAQGSFSTSVGYSSLSELTTGVTNVAVGTSAGATLTTGARNTFIGPEADTSSPSGNYMIALGSSAVANGNNEMVIGSAIDSTTIHEILPGLTARTDLGSAAKQFKDAYFSGHVNWVRPYAIAYKTSTQSVPSAVLTTITWSSPVFSDAITWNVAGNYFQTTVAGLYQVTYECNFSTASSTGSRLFYINSSSDARRHGTNSYNASSGVVYVSGSALMRLPVGAQIYITSYQASGADLDSGSNSGALYQNEFSIMYTGAY